MRTLPAKSETITHPLPSSNRTKKHQEAFDRTGRILNIIVAPANSNDPPRLLNYLTSPHVLVWSAAAVSSAAPGIFEPGYLYVRQVRA